MDSFDKAIGKKLYEMQFKYYSVFTYENIEFDKEIKI